MGRDGGVDTDRRAIRAARDALQDVLDRLAPDMAEGKTAPVLFPEGGAVRRLQAHQQQYTGEHGVSMTFNAFGTSWPAAMAVKSSVDQAATAMSAAHAEIVTMLATAVTRLDLAARNQEGAEHAGADGAAGIQV